MRGLKSEKFGSLAGCFSHSPEAEVARLARAGPGRAMRETVSKHRRRRVAARCGASRGCQRRCAVCSLARDGQSFANSIQKNKQTPAVALCGGAGLALAAPPQPLHARANAPPRPAAPRDDHSGHRCSRLLVASGLRRGRACRAAPRHCKRSPGRRIYSWPWARGQRGPRHAGHHVLKPPDKIENIITEVIKIMDNSPIK